MNKKGNENVNAMDNNFVRLPGSAKPSGALTKTAQHPRFSQLRGLAAGTLKEMTLGQIWESTDPELRDAFGPRQVSIVGIGNDGLVSVVNVNFNGVGARKQLGLSYKIEAIEFSPSRPKGEWVLRAITIPLTTMGKAKYNYKLPEKVPAPTPSPAPTSSKSPTSSKLPTAPSAGSVPKKSSTATTPLYGTGNTAPAHSAALSRFPSLGQVAVAHKREAHGAETSDLGSQEKVAPHSRLINPSTIKKALEDNQVYSRMLKSQK